MILCFRSAADTGIEVRLSILSAASSVKLVARISWFFGILDAAVRPTISSSYAFLSAKRRLSSSKLLRLAFSARLLYLVPSTKSAGSWRPSYGEDVSARSASCLVLKLQLDQISAETRAAASIRSLSFGTPC